MTRFRTIQNMIKLQLIPVFLIVSSLAWSGEGGTLTQAGLHDRGGYLGLASGDSKTPGFLQIPVDDANTEGKRIQLLAHVGEILTLELPYHHYDDDTMQSMLSARTIWHHPEAHNLIVSRLPITSSASTCGPNCGFIGETGDKSQTDSLTSSPAAIAGNSTFQCTGPSGSIVDIIDDLIPDVTDFQTFTWTTTGEELTFTLDMPGLVQPITVNKTGISPGYREYGWGVQIDVDNNPFTGTPSTGLGGEGVDVQLSISYWHSTNSADFLNLNQMQRDQWEYSSETQRWTSVGTPNLSAPPSATSFQMSDVVPGLSAESKLVPFTWYTVPEAGFARVDIHPSCHLRNLDIVFIDRFED